MPGNTLKRDGSWVVELQTPLKHAGKDVMEITIHPPGFEHVIRWGQNDIPSVLALLAELTHLPERLLRTITYPDVDRVMLAFTSMMPLSIQTDFQKGSKPFASSIDDLEDEAPVSDQIEPRFPHVDGPVRRMPPEVMPKDTPKTATPAQDGSGISAAPPPTMKAVG